MLDKHHFTGVIVGVRRDEEPTRAKERYFSPRDKNMEWNVEDQPPELWDQFKTDFEKGTHIRIHPLLHWTELNIWEYIERENIPIIPLYFANGKGERYRSLGCAPCTFPIKSNAQTVREIIEELRAHQNPRTRPAAPRTKRAKTRLRNCAAMVTCDVVPPLPLSYITWKSMTSEEIKPNPQLRNQSPLEIVRWAIKQVQAPQLSRRIFVLTKRCCSTCVCRSNRTFLCYGWTTVITDRLPIATPNN